MNADVVEPVYVIRQFQSQLAIEKNSGRRYMLECLLAEQEAALARLLSDANGTTSDVRAA